MKLNRISLNYLFAAAIFICAPTLFAGDISFVGLFKQQSFLQTNNAATADASAPFTFQCGVDSSGPNLINSASLQLPSGAQRILQAEGSDGFAFRENFSSASSLNSTYGSGTYLLTIDSANDFNFVQLTLPSDSYPSTPQITNYTAAQTLNPSNNFTFAWQSFVGGTTSDFIQLQIRSSSGNGVLSSPEFGSPGALNGTNLSFVVSSNQLFPGEIYRGELLFGHLVSVNSSSIPGANVVVAFLKRTSFDVKTTGTAPVIRLKNFGVTNGNFQFSFDTQPGRNYQVQSANTVTNWQDMGFFTANTNQIIFTDTFFIQSTSRFYRAFLVP